MKPTLADRIALYFSPAAGLRRLQARAAADAVMKRGYDAASTGRRTSGWRRARGDANATIAIAGAELRTHARDLLRNNGWTRRGRNTIQNAAVGWGLTPKAYGPEATAVEDAQAKWKAWSEAPTCEAEGRTTFAGVQRLVMRSLFADGEVLVRRRWRRPEDGLPLPLQLQVLEIDLLDTSKDGVTAPSGGKIIQGVEYDLLGRRAAYWLFPEHPGSSSTVGAVSKRVPARDIQHVFDQERPGQTRGVSWLGAAIVNLKELDDYDDAELMKQKIAACFAAFVSDRDGGGGTTGHLGEQSEADPLVETLEPGMVVHLEGDKTVTTASPPQVTTDQFSAKNLRKIAAAIGVTYEDLTGDYSQVNFGSARMGRIGFKGNVRGWQSDILIPFCAAVWGWAMEAAMILEGTAWNVPPGAEWTAPPLDMIEPDKEVRATTMAIRAGLTTPSEAIREQGGDPVAHFKELSDDFALLKKLGLKLDSDPSATSQAGLTQERAGLGGGAGGVPKADDPPEDKKPS